jgi:hypothetical protein
MAFMAAAFISAGVVKSGSPKLKLMISTPAAFSSKEIPYQLLFLKG